MWKVYFSGNFWGGQGRERAGKEIPLNQEFEWGGERWLIPAIYVCAKGYVVDICMQVPAERIRAFMDKWNFSMENDGSDFSEEEQMQAEAESPLGANIRPQLVLNGSILSDSRGCGISWNPCIPEANNPVGESILQHYDLDPAYGWSIWRSSFPWTKKRKPKITTLAAILSQEQVAISGPHFHVSTTGESIPFIHPTTEMAHRLTVQSYEPGQLPNNFMNDENYDFPTYLTTMGYTLSPDLPDDAFNVFDCASSDRPRRKLADSDQLGVMGIPAVSIGIIGGADGPTAILLDGMEQGKYRTTCSAVHFEPADQVEWRMVFYEKRCEDITVDLIYREE